ncbi:hypothetical protein CIK05_03190 [Bdellovibrio sp. qaytius]|nr:hypothetical protein CIK05_03190 [Bdellovibrio sp. qaytius]
MDYEDFWNQNANNWATVINENLIPSRSVTNLAIVSEILSQKPKSVLDIGCGEGWLLAPMTQANIKYMGIDGSFKLIEIANQKAHFFIHVNYKEIINGWQPSEKPDVVVFNFALLDENIMPLLKSVSNFIDNNGAILIQTLHPHNLPNYENGWNEEDFKTMTIPFQGKMPWYGRTKESWISLFELCNLKVNQVVEPSIEGKPASIIFNLTKII